MYLSTAVILLEISMVPIVWMILVLDPHSLGLVSTLIPVLDICSVQVKIVKL